MARRDSAGFWAWKDQRKKEWEEELRRRYPPAEESEPTETEATFPPDPTCEPPEHLLP